MSTSYSSRVSKKAQPPPSSPSKRRAEGGSGGSSGSNSSNDRLEAISELGQPSLRLAAFASEEFLAAMRQTTNWNVQLPPGMQHNPVVQPANGQPARQASNQENLQRDQHR